MRIWVSLSQYLCIPYTKHFTEYVFNVEREILFQRLCLAQTEKLKL